MNLEPESLLSGMSGSWLVCLTDVEPFCVINKNCQIHDNILEASCLQLGEVTIFKPTQRFDCTFQRVIYFITCRKCPNVCYVGLTEQMFRARARAHLRKIEHLNQGKLYKHFWSGGHTKEDVVFFILEQVPLNQNLDHRETELIQHYAAMFNTLNVAKLDHGRA